MSRGHQEISGGCLAAGTRPGGQRTIWEGECTKTNVFFCLKLIHRAFRVGGSAVTLTIYRAGAQKLAGALAPDQGNQSPPLAHNRQNPYSRALFGEFELGLFWVG